LFPADFKLRSIGNRVCVIELITYGEAIVPEPVSCWHLFPTFYQIHRQCVQLVELINGYEAIVPEPVTVTFVPGLFLVSDPSAISLY
jgi:hypothetical protein